MNGSRYGKVLTIVLIVVAVLVIGLLIFFGIDVMTRAKTDADANAGIDAFNNQVANNSGGLVLPGGDLSGTDNNIIILDPYGNLVIDNTLDNTTSGGQDGDSGATYKGYDMAGYIEIPKTDIKYPVLDDTSKNALETSVTILTGPGLNETGVTVIVGHNYRNGQFFSDNAKLAVGDKIYITDERGEKITYTVYDKYQTTPEDAAFASKDTAGKKEIVLSSCTDDSQDRIIVCAVAD